MHTHLETIFPCSFATRYGHVTKFLSKEVLEVMRLILVSLVLVRVPAGKRWHPQIG